MSSKKSNSKTSTSSSSPSSSLTFTSVPDPISFQSNIFNALIMIAVAIPALLFYRWFITTCPSLFPHITTIHSIPLEYHSHLSLTDNICRLGLSYPAEFLHFLLIINMDLLFWFVALIQGSTWLIDPYWTFIPVLIAHYYQFHPLAKSSLRAMLSLTLLYIWSTRLTHSYFRREEWQFGAREDWRFTVMRKEWEPKIGKVGWQCFAFFVVYLSQHVFLYGVTLPLYSNFFSFSSPASLTSADFFSLSLSLAGLLIAYQSDTKLRNFVKENEERKKRGEKTILILEEGWWAYSRHPNYFGEIIFWTGMSGFSCVCGQSQFTWGTVVNALCLVTVSFMVEKRMAEKKERKAQFDDYKSRVSMLIPFPFQWETKKGKGK